MLFSDKGKPVERLGRKAKGLNLVFKEGSRLPKGEFYL
jgi:hypothetical protein